MPLQFYIMLLASPWFLVVYALACILVGSLARNTRIGYWGFLILSFVLTPLVTALFLFFSTPKKGRT